MIPRILCLQAWGECQIRVFSEVSFYAVFLIDFASAQTLVASLTGQDYPVMEEMGRSVLLEVGNIVTASYLNALSQLTNLTFLPEPPLLVVDMAGAILGTVLAETNVAEDHILVLKTAFVTAAGMAEIKKRGGYTIAQDEASSVIFSMPRAAIKTGTVERVLSLEEIAGAITALCGGNADGQGYRL